MGKLRTLPNGELDDVRCCDYDDTCPLNCPCTDCNVERCPEDCPHPEWECPNRPILVKHAIIREWDLKDDQRSVSQIDVKKVNNNE